MSDSESHDLPEPFDPIEHLGPHEGSPAEPLGDLDKLFEDEFGAQEAPHAAPVVHESFTPAAPVVSTPSRAPVKAPVVSKMSKQTGVPAIVTVLLTAGVMLGGAFALSKMIPPPAAPETPATTPTAATPAPEATSAPAPASDESKMLAGKVEALGSTLDGLTKKFDDLQKQVASMPKPQPAPDLKPMETKLADLSKQVASMTTADTKALETRLDKASSGMTDLSTKLDSISTRAGEMEKTLASEKATVASIQAKLNQLSETKPAPAMAAPAATATPAATPAVNTDADFAKAADLFKKGQYAQAKDAFAKLQQASPNDARVFYYSALANGLATNQWTGETEQLVSKGVELEKSGATDPAKINAAFADLTPPQIKPWLDAYRARAAR